MRKVGTAGVMACLVLAVSLNAAPATADDTTEPLDTSPNVNVTPWGGAGNNPEIIGGTVALAGMWPFQVALLTATIANNYNAEQCGGSLVDRFHVVTAAHCVRGVSIAHYDVLTGTQSLASGGVRRKVAKIRIHPSYNPNKDDYDIAVITLKTPADVAFYAALITPAQEANYAATATSSYVTGWGSTVASGGGYPKALMQVQVPIVSRTNCNDGNSYAGDITARMICAGLTQGGKDSCDGDSGGPLIVKDPQGRWRLQAGVVSWGDGCARRNLFGVYARVAVLSGWVKSVISSDSSLVATLDCERLKGQGRRLCLQKQASN